MTYPGYQMIVVGIDPADGTAEGAEQAIAVAGIGSDRRFYVIHFEGMRGTLPQFFERAIHVARAHDAARLVLEKNYGGRALLDVLEQAFEKTGTLVPYRIVTATTGKPHPR